MRSVVVLQRAFLVDCTGREPQQDLTLLQKYQQNLLLIMKEGRIYKDLRK